MMLNGFLKILQFTMKIWKVYHGLPLVFFILFSGGALNVELCVGAYTCRFLIYSCIFVRPSYPGFECLTQVISIGSY